MSVDIDSLIDEKLEAKLLVLDAYQTETIVNVDGTLRHFKKFEVLTSRKMNELIDRINRLDPR